MTFVLCSDEYARRVVGIPEKRFGATVPIVKDGLGFARFAVVEDDVVFVRFVLWCLKSLSEGD